MKRIEKDKIKEILIEFKDNHFEQFIASVLLILIALVGLFNIDKYFLYLFCFMFFIGGYYCAIKEKGIGLAFLFTHGLIGICPMFFILTGSTLENPMMNDGATNIYIYIGIAVSLIIISFLEAVIYNLSDKLKTKKYMRFIPLITILIAMIMLGILPRIFNYIYYSSILK